MRLGSWLNLMLFCALFALPRAAYAQSMPSFGSSALVSGLATLWDHHPYEPATALRADGESLGIDFGLETTMMRMPTGLSSLLGSGISIPLIFPGPISPDLKLQFHIGLGKRVDLGVSTLWFPALASLGIPIGLTSVGGELKIVVWSQEEGPTIALRFCYTWSMLYLTMSGTDTSSAPLVFNYNISAFVIPQSFTPHVLISKKLSFADPYIGAAFQLTFGGYGTSQVITETTTSQTQTASTWTLGSLSYAGIAYIGLKMVIPGVHIMLVPEMAYSTAGSYTVGMKIGASL